jgi:DNA-binding transcriptional MerR regulator
VDYRVEELARAAGVGVDTVRFYQARGLLPAPQRRGRIALYGDAHLDRLRRIRELNRQGLTLEAVRGVLDGDARTGLRESLQRALAEAEGGKTYSRAELAEVTGLPEPWLHAITRAGLLSPTAQGGDPPRYAEVDARSLRAARELLDAGVPLAELLPLAQEHAQHVQELAARAIELFERHVRHRGDPAGELPRDEIVAAFQRLLPAATALVSLYFQRALIARVRARLGE